MAKNYLLILMLALAVGSCVGTGGLLQSIGRKFNRRNHQQAPRYNQFGHGQQAAGGSSSSSSSAAAAATTTSSNVAPSPTSQPQYYPPEPYQHQGYQPQQVHGGYQVPPAAYSPQRSQVGSSAASSASATSGGGSGSSSASAAAASAANSANSRQQQTPYYLPSASPYVRTPHRRQPAYPQFAGYHHQQAPSHLDIGSEIASATNAATASSTSGKVGGHHVGAGNHHHHHPTGSHIPAGYGTQAVYRDEAPIHYVSGPHENVHAASSGIYDGNNAINENSYYKKSHDEERNHEDGNEESDHYLATKSHGRSGEENLRIRQGRDDFDQEIGPYSMKTKKRNNFNFVDYNKNESETGTSVLEKDRHRSAYNKDTIKSREEIDAASTRFANGRTESSGLKTKSYVDDEDSEYYDSAGVHGGQGHYNGGGHGTSAAGSASAAAAAGNTASSSSSSAAAARRF